MLQCSAPELTLNMITIVLVSVSNYVLSRERSLQREKLQNAAMSKVCHRMAQMSYCTGAYGKMRAALEVKSNTTPWRLLLWY